MRTVDGRITVESLENRVAPAAAVLAVGTERGSAVVVKGAVGVAVADIGLAMTAVGVSAEALVDPLQTKVLVPSTILRAGFGSINRNLWHPRPLAGQVSFSAVNEAADVIYYRQQFCCQNVD